MAMREARSPEKLYRDCSRCLTSFKVRYAKSKNRLCFVCRVRPETERRTHRARTTSYVLVCGHEFLSRTPVLDGMFVSCDRCEEWREYIEDPSIRRCPDGHRMTPWNTLRAGRVCRICKIATAGEYIPGRVINGSKG